MDNKKRILVLEDEEAVRRLYKRMISEYGEVIETSNGQEGLELFMKEPERYDLILTDNNMPLMGGMDFLEKIAEYNYPKRLMISNPMEGTPKEMHRRVVSLGGLGLYLKPVIMPALKRIVEELLSETGVSPILEEYFRRNYSRNP